MNKSTEQCTLPLAPLSQVIEWLAMDKKTHCGERQRLTFPVAINTSARPPSLLPRKLWRTLRLLPLAASMLFLTAVLAALAVTALGHTDTDHLAGHTVLQITPSTQEQKSALHEYLDKHPMIYKWMDDLQKNNPDTVRVHTIGKSYEGLDMKGVVITFAPDQPVVMLESGIHAREWIAPAAATYFIDRILNSDENDIVRKFEWHMFPCVNPDGYVYTWTKNRSWRKTRSTNWLIFKGVDANRNWPFHWQDVGTNNIVYSEHYAGPHAESEAETSNLRKYVDILAPRMRLYLALHAYGQMLMFPWSYTKNPTTRHAHLNEIAAKAAEAVKAKNGVTYKYGGIAETIYIATGSSIDYVYSKCVPYTYVFEMRPEFSSKDTGEDAGNHGQQGFILPDDQIEDTAAEVWAGTLVLLQEVDKYPSGNNPKLCPDL
ncbi:hypothetical protein FOCC_FOCC002535 [Frankliniella occidentalis]|nr:hypothetical protein FOCC_FOCC002535 [Frankliniella occidentalis]